MNRPDKHIIYTIGHSNRTSTEFMAMLQYFHVSLVADVRRFPGSKHNPQFNKAILETTLLKSHIQYRHFLDLGGRRQASKESKNDIWKHPSFRGYADYMETPAFLTAYHTLTEAAAKSITAIMCTEAVWWRCHRSMIGDQLKADGWTVMHIMGLGVANEHPYTAPAKIVKGKLTYH